MQDAGGAGSQPPSAASSGAAGGGGLAVGGEGRRPPLPPARPAAAGNNSLHSYVSEPPSSLATLKAYAQELLQLQGQEAGIAAAQQQPQLQSNSSIPAAAPRGLSGSDGIELPQLSAGAKAAAFERLPHFQLAPQLAGPGQQPAQGAGVSEAPKGGATPLRPRMRTSIGWVSRSPSSSSSITVLEHRVAGDLIMPEPRQPPAGGGLGGAGSPSKEAGGLRRRPVLRPSQQSGAVSPSPKGAAAAPVAAAAEKQASPSKKPDPVDSDQEDELESLDFDERHKPWYRRKQFWIIVGPLLVSLVFVLAATLYLTLGKSETLSKFEVWRLCYFIAGLPVIWWIGRGSMELVVYGVEKTMFTWQGVLYLCYAVRRPMANLIRAALTTGWWALMMTGFSSQMDGTLRTWYNNVLKVLGCLTLFMTANLLKVLFAKMLARKFNQHSHYAKMHQALKREYLLHTLLQPRQNYAELEDIEGEELEGSEGGDDDMERLHSAPGQLQHKVTKQTSLQRLFRKSGLFGTRKSAPQLEATRKGSRSLKDKVMFWRGSTKDLQTIDEGEEPDEGLAQQADGEGAKGGGADSAQLPPDAVAVDISAYGSTRQTTPESPLLGQSPCSASLSLASLAPLPPAPAAGKAHAPSAHTTPHASPPPVSKLARHRSDAMEALGLPPQQQSPRASSHRGPASGSQTPIRRRRSGDSTPAGTLLGFDAKIGGQLPPVRVSQGQGGSSGSLGGLSREPSVAAAAARALGRAPRVSGPPIEIRRSASMQSHLSMRSAEQQAQQGSTSAAVAKRTLVHSASSSSSSVRDSQKALMAIKMSKMEKYIRKHALEVTFKDALSRVERSERVTSEIEAKKLGFYLYHNVKTDFNREHIVLEDLEQFLDEKDAKAAMDMLDSDGNGQVNVQECCAAIAKVFVERRNLAASLKDAKTIVGKLETVIGVALHIFMGFLYLIIFNVDVLKTWAGFASLFLGLSFIFGNSIRTTYENVVYLFLVHPYDIGEVLLVDNEQYKVEEIHLSFTVLNNSNNARVWYPNEKIRLVPLTNLTNSRNKGESFKVLVDIGTSAAVLEQLKAAAEGIIKANPKEFNGACSVNLKEGGGPLKMMISVYWEFSHTGADGGRTGRNRTKMLTALSEALHRAGVRYTWPATADGGQAASHVAASTDEAAAAAAGNAAVLL
ncbi:hypothetical protein ABPG75_005277 [Micractinium tetrahymenae]